MAEDNRRCIAARAFHFFKFSLFPRRLLAFVNVFVGICFHWFPVKSAMKLSSFPLLLLLLLLLPLFSPCSLLAQKCFKFDSHPAAKNPKKMESSAICIQISSDLRHGQAHLHIEGSGDIARRKKEGESGEERKKEAEGKEEKERR